MDCVQCAPRQPADAGEHENAAFAQKVQGKVAGYRIALPARIAICVRADDPAATRAASVVAFLDPFGGPDRLRAIARSPFAGGLLFSFAFSSAR
jgi:hypothetical protein